MVWITISSSLHFFLRRMTCTAIWITLRTLSQPPKESRLLTSETEYGREATGEVPSPAFVENATPIDAIKSPIKNREYCRMIFICMAPFTALL